MQLQPPRCARTTGTDRGCVARNFHPEDGTCICSASDHTAVRSSAPLMMVSGRPWLFAVERFSSWSHSPNCNDCPAPLQCVAATHSMYFVLATALPAPTLAGASLHHGAAVAAAGAGTLYVHAQPAFNLRGTPASLRKHPCATHAAFPSYICHGEGYCEWQLMWRPPCMATHWRLPRMIQMPRHWVPGGGFPSRTRWDVHPSSAALIQQHSVYFQSSRSHT